MTVRRMIANTRHWFSSLFLRLSSASSCMMYPSGRSRGFWRGRGWDQAGLGLEQTSMRKRKLEDLPDMFERQANIQHIANAQNSQRHWQRSVRGNSFRGSWFSPGFRGSQSNPGRMNTQETHGRRFFGSESYTGACKEDQGSQREQTVSGDQRGEDRPKNYLQGHQTRTTGSTYRQKDLFYLSKTMSRLLRHEALKAGLRMKADGYVFVSELLKCKVLQGHFTEDDVRKVTEDNDKQRFQLNIDPVSKKLMVRANQGHSIQIPDLELKAITDASEAPVVIHGTSLDIWPTVKAQGLSRMSRNHVHFSVGKPGDEGVISGMRRNCQVLIYINIKKALEDGIQFFRSTNNVILSPGDEKGFISPKYFDHVEYRLTGKNEPKTELDSTRKANSQEYQTEEAGPWKNKRPRREEKKMSQLDSRKKALL